MKNLFITGPKQIGKTTLLFSALLGETRLNGFKVVRKVNNGTVFFLLEELNSKQIRMLASKRGEKTHIFSHIFNKTAAHIINKGLTHKNLIIIDELGFFEANCKEFQDCLFTALNSNVPVLGVIKEQDNPFLKKIRCTPGVEIIRYDNRDDYLKLKQLIKTWIKLNFVY